jgi:hypothetical protein
MNCQKEENIMKKIVPLFVMLVFMSCVSAQAQMTIGKYAELKKSDRETVALYVGAMGTAFQAANTNLKIKQKQSLLYCAPLRLPITDEGYVAILDSFLQNQNKKGVSTPGDTDVAMLLLLGLQESFPCKK